MKGDIEVPLGNGLSMYFMEWNDLIDLGTEFVYSKPSWKNLWSRELVEIRHTTKTVKNPKFYGVLPSTPNPQP